MLQVALAGLLAVGFFTGPEPGLRVYVPNQMGASISVLDGSGDPVATVDLVPLGFSEHAMPHQVAAQPDGARSLGTAPLP
jgi:hypothetical protein